MHLQLIDLVYTGRSVPSIPHHIWTAAWSGLRNAKQPAEKDKHILHIVIPLAVSLACSDVLGSWVASFTFSEIQELQNDRPVFYVISLILLVLFMTAIMNLIGYILHLFYCVVLEGGTYSSTDSLTDFWSCRWHQLMKSTWTAFPYRPTYRAMDRALTKYTTHHATIARAFGVLSVFAASGLMHEFTVLAFSGWTLYTTTFVGQQMLFFLVNGLATIVDQSMLMTLPNVCRRLVMIAFLYFTAPLFFSSIFEGGVIDGHSSPPYSNQSMYAFVKAHPSLQPYFGPHLD
ncbi:hypothetical protein [Absidia glauca]|uniref:Wax synthase domain-containing protein n=1 Tax=Absidia glauca TaxID=4829 RepID=A0A163IXW7_ABSGL|nr:hypothetical protein [Absidia glauca]